MTVMYQGHSKFIFIEDLARSNCVRRLAQYIDYSKSGSLGAYSLKVRLMGLTSGMVKKLLFSIFSVMMVDIAQSEVR